MSIDYNDTKWFRDSWVIDIDPDWPYFYLKTESKEAALASVKEYFDKFVGSGVTDLTVCPFEQNSSVPTKSKHIDWLYEKSTWTEENGIPVDYSNFNGVYKVFTEYGIDVFEEIYKAVKERNIRPWLTLRMNDAHYGYDETAYLRSNLYYEAKRDGMMIGEHYGYYAHNYNFAYEKIRNVMLEYIEEIFLRYDVFGYQLDFIREIFCFDYLNDTGICDKMTDFIRKVKAIVKKAEEKFGHSIKLSVRFGRSIEHNKVFGFDAETWIKEGLVDCLVPSPRWECTDSAIPVDEWKALAGENVAVFAGMEPRLSNVTVAKDEYVKGYAAGFYAKGADGVYFDNYYHLGSEGPSIWGFEREQLTDGVRRFVVTRQDVVPEGYKGYHPLPFRLSSEGHSFDICMGNITPSESIYVAVAYSNGSLSIPSMKINGVKALSAQHIDLNDSFFRSDNVPTHMDECQFVLYSFAGVEVTDDIKITFENGAAVIEYIEIAVKP